MPQPRVALAQAVRDCASAAMDVSDGLAGDLAKLCAASGVSAAIDAQSIPLSAAARALPTMEVCNLSRVQAAKPFSDASETCKPRPRGRSRP